MYLRKAFVLIAATSLLSACVAELQTPYPTLVGSTGNTFQYSISGFTSWGEMEKQQAVNIATKYMHEMCSKEPKLIDVQTYKADQIGHHQLGWMAVFSCKKIRGSDD